ncbi:MAG: tripartite tricarboxylate transporter substrate binding protein [Rhodovarius sp.]|nr:tripartite tricarboxylate transporter substrate binding protein [Rhodovarius sp.]MCX7932982.1 tripartite tricarboxylate transporter substrate binding protein [Rhodovarius sp.]MDW8314815.1 tripartite tricarboxylate transporter substrate binding protein [Rhodovarius sp.]
MPPIPRRRAGLLLAALPAPALSQGGFPDRPIRFLIPWSPGGVLDGFLRLTFDIAAEELGQPFVIENRPGARGTLAASFLVNQARPDGYTLAHHHLSVMRHPLLTRARSWDPIRDFTYIMRQSGFVFGIVVRADSPWRSLADLWAAARAAPERITYATSGIATTNHLAMEELCARENVRMEHIVYRGASDALNALLGRQIHAIAGSNTWAPAVESGQLRLLVVWTRERLAAFPDVPTLLELGYGMVVTSPYGIAGPRGMAPEVVERLHRALRRAHYHPRVQDYMRRFDMPDEYLGPAEYLAWAEEHLQHEQALVRRLQLSID